MESNETFTIRLSVFDRSDVVVTITSGIKTAEDVCVYCCRYVLGIKPAARHLFGLIPANSQYWLSPHYEIPNDPSVSAYCFRLRFHPAFTEELSQCDEAAFNYYFSQTRHDFIRGRIEALNANLKTAFGLGTADMYRYFLENKGTSRETVWNEYKRFLPKEVQKSIFIKNPIRKNWKEIENNPPPSINFVKVQYLKRIFKEAPDYLSETYVVEWDNQGVLTEVQAAVSPFNEEQPGLSLRFPRDRSLHLCSIEDLCFISKSGDGRVEISRKNGIPIYLRIKSSACLQSFVSCLSGYYRLMEKWTFDLCGEMCTPSVLKLCAMKCHGPVGLAFACQKLSEKRNNKPGSYMMRENESEYDQYYLDFCIDGSERPKTLLINSNNEGKLGIEGFDVRFPSLTELVIHYKEEEGEVKLTDCLLPSEYDKSGLLLCRKRRESNMSWDSSGRALPVCIPASSLLVYNKPDMGLMKGKFTLVQRHVWEKDANTRLEVVRKFIKPELYQDLHQDFIEKTYRSIFWMSECIVIQYGVLLKQPFSLVMEFLPLGPLDRFLGEHEATLQEVDLVEAGTYLAKALWYLEENGFVHGNIRCRNVLVESYNEDKFRVKLADPGLPSEDEDELPWIPIEFRGKPHLAQKSQAADVWAFGTTLWEIFSYGQKPTLSPIKCFMLTRPAKCSKDIFRIMRDCWIEDVHQRKRAQAIMRDINQILCEVFNSRRKHTYTSVDTSEDDTATLMGDLNMSTSETTLTSLESSLATQTDLLNPTQAGSSESDLIQFSSGSRAVPTFHLGDSDWSEESVVKDEPVLEKPSLDCLLSGVILHTSSSAFSFDEMSMGSSMSENFVLDRCQVELGHRIGQGNFGEVWKGMLKSGDGYETVAVKRVKNVNLNDSSAVEDLLREITIMKTLRHPNIVEIKGVVEIPDILLVMEYVPGGSLETFLKTKKESITNAQLLKFAEDIAEGMEYLGEKEIVHRDLAARNILVASDDQVKISDFGLAQHVGSHGYYRIKTQSRGLPFAWYAPEIFQYGKFSVQSDVWSYGVTLYEMFSRGERPQLTADQKSLLFALQRGERLSCPKECPQLVYRDLMRPCWSLDPHQRPSFSELLHKIRYLETRY